MSAAKNVANSGSGCSTRQPDPADERRTPTRLSLATDVSEPQPSPARLLQADLQRLFSPGPVRKDRFSKRRAAKFIVPTSAAVLTCIAVINHLGQH